MKTTFLPTRLLPHVLTGILLGYPALSGWSVTITNFGYRAIDPSNSRPLLVIMGDFDCFPERRITRDNDYYRRLIFDRNTYPSLNGFLWENSLGRFQVTPAGPGVIGPFVMSTNESFPYFVWKYPVKDYPDRRCETFYYSNVIQRVIDSGLVDFASFDPNGNSEVEVAELSMTFMNNYGGGASRRSTCLRLPGISPPYYVGCWSDSAVFPTNYYITANHAQGDFESMAHEQLHQLGLLDLYGRRLIDPGDELDPGNLSTMGFTIPPDLYGHPENSNAWYTTATWNLDPWNRMLLGWCEPRLASMDEGGRFILPAAQLHRADGPILLYSPNSQYTTNDYFLLEYRTPDTKSAGHGYDANMGTAGLVIWHFHPDDPKHRVPFVYTEGPTNLVDGSYEPWPGGSLTPNLAWRPNIPSAARIYVHPFDPGDDYITIDILVSKDTYVDFASTVQPESGSYTHPYNTLAEGVAAASWGSTIQIKGGGHSAEKIQISKATKLTTYGTGSVTLGR
jgi:M6 family metalloprotease-like protein